MQRAEDITPSVDPETGESLFPVEEAERGFGRYHLRYEIASGGMASVYLARARGPAGFDRAVAIKRIHPHLAKKRGFVEMFLDEARLNARITHPNVCTVFDFGEVEGTYFMAMEYLVGQPLSRVLAAVARRDDLAGTPRWNALAARILADACEGLHAAHELRDEAGRPMNVVHRDFTPQNVFVTYGGAVKVVDFGVARAEGRLHQTETGTLKGKLAYMSPEQVGRRACDRRLDVWAAGVCLWELLTVKRLFGKRSEVDILQAISTDVIEPPSEVRPGVPPELDAIVMRALARDPSERTPTARALARELNQFVSSTGVSTALADVAELMEDLFAEEREQKLGVVASVLETSVEHLSELSGAPMESGVLAARSQQVPLERSGEAAPPAPEGSPEPGHPWLRPRILGGALVLSVLAAVAGAALLAIVLDPPTADEPTVVVTQLEPGTESGTDPATAPATDPATDTATRTATEAVVETAAETAAGPRAEAEAEPPAVRRPVRASSGDVNVVARGGWADIYVDGSRVGRTPRSLTLSAGRHVIELRPEGRSPGERHIVNVRGGQTQRLIVEL